MKTTGAFVIMIDIVKYSLMSHMDAASCVKNFYQLLKTNLEIINKNIFNIFSIGDGAIICIYPRDISEVNKIAELPLLFAKQMLKIRKDLMPNIDIRISINYGPMETLINVVELKTIDSNNIQIGTGINIAERIIHFCDPNEIIISLEYHNILHALNLDKTKYKFHPHIDVFVKHMENLKIYSYIPSNDEKGFIYDLRSEGKLHFKKYAYFPPITDKTFKTFKKLNLEDDLQHICSYAFDTLAAINNDWIFVSWGEIYSTLEKIPTEQEDEILIISRDDLKVDFWSTREAQNYLKRLETMKGDFKQFRIFIYDSNIKRSTPPDVYKKLEALHRRGTLKQINKKDVFDNVLVKYSFGLTIYPRLGCAIAPLPVPIDYDEYINHISFTKKIENVFHHSAEYDFNYKFKALVIANSKIVDNLIDYYNLLKNHSRLENIDINKIRVQNKRLSSLRIK